MAGFDIRDVDSSDFVARVGGEDGKGMEMAQDRVQRLALISEMLILRILLQIHAPANYCLTFRKLYKVS
jgi:hypothetical protein